MPDRQPPRIEFWFDFASPYSYLALMRIEDAAARRGVTVDWKPFLLGPVFQALGYQTSPVLENAAKARYLFSDMARQAQKYGLGWCRPSEFPRNSVLPARVAVLAQGESWLPEFCRRVMLRNFVEDRDIGTPEAVAEVLVSLQLPGAELIAAARGDDNRQRLRRQVEEAGRRGLFGAPSLLIGNELFWGNDRLDDALEFAARSAQAAA